MSRRFFKVPYQYEPYIERGIENAPRYEDNASQNPDLLAIYQATADAGRDDYCQWIRDNEKTFSSDTLIVDDGKIETERSSLQLIVSLRPFNDIRHFNTFLKDANRLLADGGTLALFGETSGMRRHRMHAEHTRPVARFMAVCDYLYGRVLPKLELTRKVYMRHTKGVNRNFPRVEVLGRMAKAGFDITSEAIHGETFYVSAIRRRDPIDREPNYGIFVRLPRKTMGGKIIGVYKLRTMYAYSEYIQDYTYQLNGLEKGGKLKDDFRVNLVGSYCRSRFIDELPMLINLFKGELKFFGVRPISAHYLSLYTPEMQKLHLSVKPGVFPPLYSEYPKPSTIEEIQESERRYIEAYLQHPFRTDWIYFWGMVRNILFHHERSH